MTAKIPQKQGRILEGGENFSGWPEYIPLQLNLRDVGTDRQSESWLEPKNHFVV